ncbi:NADH-quinone oxidoreductase subunit NuoE [Desulfosporosinus sp. BICA1-9]|uniref:NADH-quinone oxidoreductase subunit NuoE n=1 Tax=Desulfosporosinus sp. BICA1-9 TaxID=1531958 RepID=UPI00054BE2FC|nr:NADH-quinone oxidoreductase subunit NuoE [Desulfosporosinus sp. BICA1-9]KJS48507.1 MAG: hypothetical protein VR66_13610 [Peptococcaceae bacterium BRH_c23]KJS84142.1 MAG: hypothetical protein JL57_21405 [Desulfosporosinus sp. BICA1-9]KJS84194.1 MAG: hypothetical protein JL57_21245 [Desulfosporosinus sp. BICA1-9]
MSNSTCTCCLEDDQEKYQRIAEIIEEYKAHEGSLIQILHIAQGIFGYLPLELQQFIAEKMELPLSEVYGVVTFYSYFALRPRGKYTIRVCMGTACYVRGAKKIVDELKKKLDIKVGETTEEGLFTLEVARCIGACGLAPVMTVNDTVYQRVNPEELDTILGEYTNK